MLFRSPIIRIHNIETDEIIDREMTDDEYAEFVKTSEQVEEKQNAEQAKIDEKNALLEKLGITEEEAKLLLS